MKKIQSCHILLTYFLCLVLYTQPYLLTLHKLYLLHLHEFNIFIVTFACGAIYFILLISRVLLYFKLLFLVLRSKISLHMFFLCVLNYKKNMKRVRRKKGDLNSDLFGQYLFNNVFCKLWCDATSLVMLSLYWGNHFKANKRIVRFCC